VLREHAPQIHLPRLGPALGPFALTACECLATHRGAGAVGADIEHRRLIPCALLRLPLPLLPRLGGVAHRRHPPLNLAGRHGNPARFGQGQLRFLIAGCVRSLQTEQPGQGRRVAAFPTQRRIGRGMPLVLARVIVVVALQLEVAKEALDLPADPRLDPWPGWG
jgi:hypothetical protein